MSELSQLLYFSHIEGPRPFETVSAIVAESRPRNTRSGISGLLVFDGAHVCQYIEGEREEVEALHQRLVEDTRHSAMQVLLKEPLSGPRRFARWRLGYLTLDDGRDLSLFGALGGEAAVQVLLGLVPGIDLEP